MGKIRVAKLGDELEEKEQKKRAEKRREAKKEKKKELDAVDTSASVDAEQVVVSQQQETEDKPKKEEKKERKAHQRSKQYQEAHARINRDTFYPLSDAVSLVKQTSMTKFDGTVELHVNLIPVVGKEKGDLRKSVKLPHATGKETRVAIADEKIIENIGKGVINFDVLVSHPSMMPKLARVARILGPRGLMPNPKNGTVTPDPEKKAKELASGTVQFKTEPGQPIFHLRVGKVSFDDKQLTENIDAYLDAIGRINIAKATLTATMGPGVKLQVQ